MKRYNKLIESKKIKLVHASDNILKIIKPSKRGGSYFFDAKELHFPFEEFNNIISINEVNKIVENAPEEKNIYMNIAFNYGDYLHIVDINLQNILDLTNINNKNIILLKNNINEFKKLSNIKIKEIIENFYDTKYENILNKFAKINKYDALKLTDNIEGYNHTTYILYKDIKVKN